MKQLKRLGIGLGLILIGMSGTVQAQSIYANSIWATTQSMFQIKVHDDIDRCLIENNCQSEPPPPAPEPPAGHTGSQSNDFDGDGRADLLWRHSITGEMAVWFMDGATITSSPTILAEVPLEWSIEGVADVNGDGRADLLWRHSVTGDVAVWFMDGATITSSPTILAEVPLEWSIEGVADVNGDGRADLLWRHKCSGDVAGVFIDGATIVSSSIILPQLSFEWSIVPGPIIEQDPLCKASG